MFYLSDLIKHGKIRTGCDDYYLNTLHQPNHSGDYLTLREIWIRNAHNETNIPTQSNQTGKKSWLSQTDVYKARKTNYQPEKSKRQGSAGRVVSDRLAEWV